VGTGSNQGDKEVRDQERRGPELAGEIHVVLLLVERTGGG